MFFSISLCIVLLIIIIFGEPVARQSLGVGKKLVGLGLLMPLGRDQETQGFTAAMAVGASDGPLVCLFGIGARTAPGFAAVSGVDSLGCKVGTGTSVSVEFPLPQTLQRELDILELLCFVCLYLLVLPGCNLLLSLGQVRGRFKKTLKTQQIVVSQV